MTLHLQSNKSNCLDVADVAWDTTLSTDCTEEADEFTGKPKNVTINQIELN